MHAAQYLWITSYYARREAGGGAGQDRRATGGRWLTSACWLSAASHCLFRVRGWRAALFHHDFTSSFLIFTALVNIHHFILDGAIWKLRDGRIASLLLNSREKISDAASEAGGRFAAAGRWLVGSTVGARSLRVGTAMLLLAWGTVDQARYYLALHTDDLQDLQRAEALNSFDSSLQMRLAHRAMEDGQTQQAEAAWKRAVQANPADPAARQALLRFLIDQNRYDEAVTLTDASLKITPKDANLLVDRGLLAQRSGHADQSLASWNQALAVDPGQSLAHLYIADELDREGKAQAAASHYNAFLGTIVRQPASGTSGAGSRDRHRVAHGGLPGALFADGSGASVLSPGREDCCADSAAEAGKRGRRKRGRPADQGRKDDGGVAALPARPATG